MTARIKYTLHRLSSVHPALAEHLAATLHTGVYCRYSPRCTGRGEVGLISCSRR